ncbi:hypothetical protein Efla_000689 [Eimeria flavescens]
MEPAVDCFIDLPNFGKPPKSASSEDDKPLQVASRLQVGGGPCPSARGGHTATLVGSKVYVFGGHELRGVGKGFTYHNDVYVLDLKELCWEAFHRQRGTPPAPRYGHSACLFGSRIIIFGGKGGPNVCFQDLHALDVEASTWYKGPSRAGDPAPRLWHSSNIADSCMYVFGGVSGVLPLGDLHALDLNSMDWKELKPRGRPPRARFGHASVLTERHLIIHGGMAKTVLKEGETDASLLDPESLRDWYLSDMHALNISELTWHRASPSAPPRLAAPSSSEQQRQLQQAPPAAAAAAAGAAAAATGTALEEAVREIPFAAAAALCSYKGKWHSVFVKGPLPVPRHGHSCTETADGLLLIGGWTSPLPLFEVICVRQQEEEEAVTAT